VKRIAPQYVLAFVKRQKSDATDAEAIVITAQRPEMRFVVPKSEDQQALPVGVSAVMAVTFRSVATSPIESVKACGVGAMKLLLSGRCQESCPF
jgi:hypothetical protein